MTVRILVGDCRARLAEIPDASVQCVVTSPPYYGLRDYGTGAWEGGDPDCAHVVGEMRRGLGLSSSKANTRGGAKKVATTSDIKAAGVCPHCSAVRLDQQIGLEPTPEAYVASLVEVFRQVRRVLRADGTLWLNLGDSYAAGGNGGHQRSGPAGDLSTLEGRRDRKTPSFHGHKDRGIAERLGERRTAPAGLKPKDLIGIPWRVAFALQADGWFLRQDIIWAKPNPMPESVTDRCTKAHEYLFLLAKSGRPTIWRARDTGEWSSAPDHAERLPRPTEKDPDATAARWRGFDYYFDQDAIAEELQTDPRERYLERARITGRGEQGAAAARGADRDKSGGFPPRTKNSFARPSKDSGGVTGAKPQFRPEREPVNYEGRRNKRSVWSVATTPFTESHFATFPPALIEPCILAGSPSGGGVTILDPFGGAGTTALVADRLGRDAICIELNPSYAEMAERRLAGDAGMFASVEVAA